MDTTVVSRKIADSLLVHLSGAVDTLHAIVPTEDKTWLVQIAGFASIALAALFTYLTTKSQVRGQARAAHTQSWIGDVRSAIEECISVAISVAMPPPHHTEAHQLDTLGMLPRATMRLRLLLNSEEQLHQELLDAVTSLILSAEQVREAETYETKKEVTTRLREIINQLEVLGEKILRQERNRHM